MRKKESLMSPTLALIFDDLYKDKIANELKDARKSFAKELFDEGFSDEKISNLTKLELDEIAGLRKQ